MNVLLSLGNDLASSIAIRYLSQQAADVSMNIQPLHIEEEEKHFPLGTGWVKNTWHDTVVSSSQDEINNFIHNEIRFCNSLSSALTMIGDRDRLTLTELRNGKYKLFVMGLLSTFSTQSFYELINGGMMEKLSCPVLLVKNLRDFSSVSLLCRDGMQVNKLISDYLDAYGKASVDLHLLHIEADDQGSKKLEKLAEVPPYLKEACEVLSKAGCPPASLATLKGMPQQIAESLKDQGMVVSILDKSAAGRCSFFDILAYVPTPLLLFWS